MNILHETEKDKYYLVLDEDQLNKEFIYFTYVLNGPSDAGPSGGDMGEAFILEFRKFKEDIGIYKKNTKFTYDESNKISQSKLTNIIEAFAPVALTASSTVLKISTPSKFCPPLPGVTPETTLVP